MKSNIAILQYELSADGLQTLLALTRAGTLAEAGVRLGVDSSTVFRNLAQIERGLGQALFVRARTGLVPNDLALALVPHAERMEAELEAARVAAQSGNTAVSGSVRVTTTDTLLHGLLLPALGALAQQYPLLRYELIASNEVASLTRRDADIALRATRKPPEHLVGRALGAIDVAVFAAKKMPGLVAARRALSQASWIGPDEALPDHPSVRWRKQHFPRMALRYQVNSIASVLEAVRAGLGVGVVPLFLAKPCKDVIPISQVLPECSTQLWLLTHAESRYLRRVSTVYQYLASTIKLPG